jgi:small-conductance mechanosensitive channel
MRATIQLLSASPRRPKPWLRALVLALVASAARAQPEGAAAPASGAAPAASEAAPAAIPLSEIGAEAESVEGFARGVESELGREPEGSTRELLARTAQEISERQAALEAIPTGPEPGRALSAARAGWQVLDAQLAGAQDEVERAADGLDRRLAELRERHARWSLTAAEARDAGVPASVQSEVREVLARLEGVREHVERRRNEMLALGNAIRLQRRSVDAGLERVVALRAELRGRLFARDEPPLWSLRPVADSGAELRRMAAALEAMGAEARDYALRHREHLLAQLALLVFLVWAAVRGRPTLRRLCGEAEPAAHVLTHPVAAGLLASLAPWRLFHPDAPPGFLAVGLVLGLPLWLRVLAGVLPRSLHASLRWLAVLVLLNVARETLHPLPLLPRLLLLLQLALGAAVVVGLRRPGKLALVLDLGGRAWRRALDLWLRLALVAFAAGIPAALLGWVELAGVLASSPVLGSLLATVLLVMVLLLELLLRALVESGALDSLHLIRAHRRPLLRGAGWLLRLAAAAAWLYAFLDSTTFGDPLWPWIGRMLAAPLQYGSVSLTPGGVLAFALALWGSWLVARLTSLVLEEEVFPRLRMPPGIPFALATFTRYAVLFIGFVVSLGLIGFSLDRVTILIGALGVGLGFGLQNVVNNFVSGVILLFERPIRVGDRIQLEDLVGDVTRIGIRASRVRTLDGIDLIVPNGDFVSARVANWTLHDQARRVSLPVGVAYGTPPRRVIELLGGVARAHPEVLASPEPEVLFRGFGESSLDFELRVWTDSRLFARVQSDLAVATYDVLEQAGIAIPFPQRDLHLRSVSPEARDALAGGAPEGRERRAPVDDPSGAG